MKYKEKSNIGPLAYETGSETQDSKPVIRIHGSNFASVFTVEDIEIIPEGQEGSPPRNIDSTFVR